MPLSVWQSRLHTAKALVIGFAVVVLLLRGLVFVFVLVLVLVLVLDVERLARLLVLVVDRHHHLHHHRGHLPRREHDFLDDRHLPLWRCLLAHRGLVLEDHVALQSSPMLFSHGSGAA